MTPYLSERNKIEAKSGLGRPVSHILIGGRWPFVHFISEMKLKTYFARGEEESQYPSIIVSHDGCVSYFEKNTMTKRVLWKKEFILAYGSRGTVHNVRRGMKTDIQSWNLRDHICSSKNEAKRANLGEESLGTFSALPTGLPPARLYFPITFLNSATEWGAKDSNSQAYRAHFPFKSPRGHNNLFLAIITVFYWAMFTGFFFFWRPSQNEIYS